MRTVRVERGPVQQILSAQDQGVLAKLNQNLYETIESNDDVFYLFLQKQNLGAKLHIYLEEGTYPKRLFRGPSTNDMKK
jgi:hypothetical protein